jgi:ZIP family zinc transporter
MIGVGVAALACLSTLLGGFAAVRIHDRLHLLIGFASGAVMGVVFFDVLPEFVERSEASGIALKWATLFIAAGFLAFYILESVTALHGAREHEHKGSGHHSEEMGIVAAAGLSVHSFLDGLAIGVGFRTDTRLGVAIALAVLVHDFSDGLNTVTVVLAHGNPLRRALRWLVVDATTPVLGAAVALVTPLSGDVLPGILGVFVGFFLYIGASDLLPEAREHESPWPKVATLVGMSALFAVTRVL